MNPVSPEERSFVVPVGAITIGRTKDNEVCCAHKSLSRRHAKVEFDGRTLQVSDLQSKNGIFHNGKRAAQCELRQGDTLRCGDITFRLEGGPARVATTSAPAQTLPSPLIMDGGARRPSRASEPQVVIEEEQRSRDRLFLVVRASELLVGTMTVDRLLEELVALAVQVVDADRMVLLARDEATLAMKPRVARSFAPSSSSPAPPFSRRVVDRVLDHGGPASFSDVSRDRTLPGDPAEDAAIRSAMCVAMGHAGKTLGALYADNLDRADAFRPDDLALFRALANIAAVAIDRA